MLAAGLDVAVLTDAGTPGISDPGARLVRAAIAAGYRVSAVPGPAALVMGLVLSGFDTTRFVFEGFLPRSGKDRKQRIAAGSGTSVQDINALLRQFREMQRMMQMIGRGNIPRIPGLFK